MSGEKIFKLTFLGIIIIEFLSLFSYLNHELGQILFFIISVAVLIAALIKINFGFYILLAEIFIGSKGYLFSLTIGDINLSIRIVIFLIIFLAWLIQKLKTKKIATPKDNLIYLYLLFFIFVAAGLIIGLIKNNLIDVFFDFNAWLFFALILLFFEQIKSTKQLHNIIAVLIAASTWLAIKSIFIFCLFSHGLATIGGYFYKWIRDSGVGEITYLHDNIFRIFFQSQIYNIIGLLIIFFILINNWSKLNIKYRWLGAGYLYLSGITIIISQSRSFWVGLVAGLLFLLLISKINFSYSWKKIIFTGILIATMFLSQLLIIQIIAGNFTGNLISSRLTGSQASAADSTRANELEPLKQGIFNHPIFGSGFGAKLTYKSQDPRVLKNNPDGQYTTYAFEWGYLDIWLKIGLLGLISYLVLIGQIIHQSAKKYHSDDRGIIIAGLVAGLVAVIVTNIFSPYLNHPLGINYLMIVSAAIIF